MKPFRVGLLGLGTVGSGTARILIENADLIERRLGRKVVLARAVDLNIDRDFGFVMPRAILGTKADEVFADPDIDVVVELVGGIEPARTFIRKALAAGKHVVTANKKLLAEKWEDLFPLAAEKGVEIWFEASVGGGIPIIRSLREGLAANNIEAIQGIVNGTSNYILSRMTEEGLDFASALAEAQKLGYAEADPTLDVGGGDAAHKICILATLAFGERVPMAAVHTEGITAITPIDIRFADEMGYVIKLLGLGKASNGTVEVRVHPTMISKKRLLATVGGAFNAIYVRGDAVGSTLYYGPGAGSMPTGSAVVGDIMSLAAKTARGPSAPWPVPVTTMPAERLKPIDEIVSPYYVRFSALDKPGVLSAVSGILGRHGISIASVLQKGRHEGGAVPLVMMTHEARERNIRRALEEIGHLDVTVEQPTLIRVEESN
jgi:homoserine dehydrogenase